MIVKQILILLTTPENYPFTPNRFPTLTHYRIVNVKFEVKRPLMNHDGIFDIWMAKGYIDNSKFYESYGVEGVHFLITNQVDIQELATYQANGTLFIEMQKKICQFLIDKG